MKIASYNVENLFRRVKALDTETWEEGKKILPAFSELNTILQKDLYEPADKARILELLLVLGIGGRDEGVYAQLRQIREHLVSRPKGGMRVIAKGRADWIGWIELKTETVTEQAMEFTAQVIKDVGADLIGVVEAESRPALQLFTKTLLKRIGGEPYEQVMLVDGNDDRGIDVGILARAGFPLIGMRSHVFDSDSKGPIFSRDCCEYHFETPAGTLVILMNHFKSKGYSDDTDPGGGKRRRRQAKRTAEIYQDVLASGHELIAVMGDLNDTPDSYPLEPLLGLADLTNIADLPGFQFGERTGTYQSSNDQIDYILLSPALKARTTGGGIFREGVFCGPRTTNRWATYPGMTERVFAASDHAAIWATINLEKP